MKAAVCYEFGKPLVVEEVTLDPPRQGEVKVRLAATGVCHSDIHHIRGEWGGDLPVVVGHEAAGIVEEVGEGVTRIKPGDTVVTSLLRSCGHCFYCTTGSPHMCESEFSLAVASRLRTKDGVPIHPWSQSAFAEYSIVDQSQVVSIPADMPLDRAALLACCVTTGLGAVANTAQIEPLSSVVVIGVGGVGLNAVQGAVLAGAHPIIAVDLLDTKLTMARAFGATHSTNAGQQDTDAVVKELTSGRGADYTFVTVGNSTAVAQAVNITRMAGTVVIVGMPNEKETLSLPIRDFVWSGRKIIGSRMGSTHVSLEIPQLVELYRHGRLKLDELVTAHYPLEQINEAIEVMEKGEAIRNVIVFSAAG